MGMGCHKQAAPIYADSWVMSMPTSSLKEFAQAIPVCEQTCDLATVLEIFRSSGGDTIAVVNEQQHPLGVINLRQVMPYVISPAKLGEPPVGATEDFYKPLYQLNPPIIQPLARLPAHLNLNQFWVYLQESQRSTPAWKLRTDTWRLDKTLSNSQSPITSY